MTYDEITNLYAMLVEAPAEKISGEVFNAGGNNYKVIEIAEMAKESNERIVDWISGD